MSALEQHAFGHGLLRQRRLIVLAMAMLVFALSPPARADIKDVLRPATTKKVCEHDARGAITGPCHDVFVPAFPNAGECTRYFRAWHLGDTGHEDNVDACIDFMGLTQRCKDMDAYVTTGYVDAPGTWNGDLRILQCTRNHHPDDIVDQFVHIWTGIGQGLITAAPFVAEGVLLGACAYGQIYACAVLALEVSDQAGIRIPTQVGDALYIANKAPQCIDGDVVACAYLGARGAKAVGLEIPGVPALKIIEDQQRCTDGEFAACVRLGKEAADAGGIEIGAAPANVIDAQACLDGHKDTCVALAKEAIKEHTPLKGVAGVAEDLAACENHDEAACRRAGQQLAATAFGLTVSTPKFAPFGANACTSAVIAKGPLGLASAWNDRNYVTVSAFPSDGSQFGIPNHPSGRDGGWGNSVAWVAADFNGDGITDLASVWNNGGHNTITVRQSTGTPQFKPVVWAPDVGTWLDNQVWLPGDYNGDGHMDIAQVWDEGGMASFVVYLSDGVQFTTGAQWSRRDGGWGDEIKWAAGDFNGDGKTDIAAIWNNGGNNTITLRQSTGSGFRVVTWASNAGGWQDSTVWLPGDFNGDGRTDLAGVWHDGNGASIAVYPSDGSRFAGWSQWIQHDGGWSDEIKWTAGDFNGDGKADIAAAWNNGGKTTLSVRQSTGAAFTVAHWRIDAEPWRDSAAWCVGLFPQPLSDSYNAKARRHDAIPASPPSGAASEVDDQRPDSAVQSVTDTSLPPAKALGRVAPRGPVDPSKTMCDYARSAKARNSPAAPALEKRCLEGGGSMTPPP